MIAGNIYKKFRDRVGLRYILFNNIYKTWKTKSLTTESLISYTVSVFVSFASYTAKNISKFLR